jgi:hypothetical protein
MVRPPISKLNIKKRKIFNFDYTHGVFLDTIRRDLILKSFRYAMLLKSDSEVVLAVQQNGLALRYVPENLRNYKKVVLAAVQQNSGALRFASKKLRSDKEVVLAAVRSYGEALRFASKKLRGDKEVVLTAVQQNGGALRFASKKLRGDKEVVLAASKEDYGNSLKFASKECILYILQNKDIYDDFLDCTDSCILELVSPKLKKDREIVVAAIQTFETELGHALPKFRNDKKFILTIAEKNKLNLEYVSKKLRDDEEIVLSAIKQDAIINNVYSLGPAVFLTFASSRLQRDKTFLMKCYRANKKTKYFSNIIKNFDKMSKYF